jgi:hypothetical protein
MRVSGEQSRQRAILGLMALIRFAGPIDGILEHVDDAGEEERWRSELDLGLEVVQGMGGERVGELLVSGLRSPGVRRI